MQLIVIATTLLGWLLLLLVPPTQAFPNMAGHCDGGSIPDPNAPHPNNDYRSLHEGGYSITIGDHTLPREQEVPLQLTVGEEYDVKIERSNGNTFKGLLFRLPIADAFTYSEGESDIGKHEMCDPGSVSGVTHFNRNAKTKVEFKMKVTETRMMNLDITSVVAKAATYYYSLYELDFVVAGPPTAAPVRDPTAAPVRDPTAAPVRDPTAAPVRDPTAAPVRDPTAAPVRDPTAAPVRNPTAAPVRDPTAAPVRDPTAAPITSPASECIDSKLRLRINGKQWKTCRWVGRNPEVRCQKRNVPTHCPLTCDSITNSCSTSICVDSRRKFKMKESGRLKRCGFFKRNPDKCDQEGVASTCRLTCEYCDPSAAPVRNPTAAPVRDPTAAPVRDPTAAPITSPASECIDSKLRLRINGKQWKTCGWVRRNPEVRCQKQNVPTHCPLTCDSITNSCSTSICVDSRRKFKMKESGRLKRCGFFKRNPNKCDQEGVASTCRLTCEYCD